MLLMNYIKRYFLEYHDSIDTLPIFNFMECLDGKLQYLYKCDISKLPTKYPKKFRDIIKELFYQLDYVDTTLYRLENRIAHRLAKYVETGKSIYYVRAMNDKSLLSELQKNQMNKIGDSKKMFVKNLTALSRFQNYHIDKYTISTREFFNILNDYKESIKAKENG